MQEVAGTDMYIFDNGIMKPVLDVYIYSGGNFIPVSATTYSSENVVNMGDSKDVH